MASKTVVPGSVVPVPVLALTPDHDLLVSLNVRMSIAIEDMKRWQETTLSEQIRSQEKLATVISRVDKAEGSMKGWFTAATVIGGFFGSILSFLGFRVFPQH
jgi:hypothetical protein